MAKRSALLAETRMLRRVIHEPKHACLGHVLSAGQRNRVHPRLKMFAGVVVEADHSQWRAERRFGRRTQCEQERFRKIYDLLAQADLVVQLALKLGLAD